MLTKFFKRIFHNDKLYIKSRRQKFVQILTKIKFTILGESWASFLVNEGEMAFACLIAQNSNKTYTILSVEYFYRLSTTSTML